MTCTARRPSRLAILVALVTAACSASVAHAEETSGAARLSYLNGDAIIERADNTGTDPAQLNMPLLEGMRLVTASGEAEIELVDGSVVRLTPRTAVALTALDAEVEGHNQTVLTVLYGLIYAEVRVTNEATTILHAGPDTITPVTNTALRILFDKPPAAVAALAGTARVEHTGADAASGFAVDLDAGEWLDQGGEAEATHTVSQSIPYETWDDWNERRAELARDDLADRTTARDAYADDQAYGWSDLDSNGFWYDMAGQDLVWQPFAAASPDFDPYAGGSWSFAGGDAGYVWASAYAWGWTPFRCGSWAYSDSFGWGWSPGASCGTAGWHSGTGGVNISRLPPGYHRPVPPARPGPSRAHPIVIASSHRRDEPDLPELERTFGGVPALPLRPIASVAAEQGASAIGSSLARDFPVSRGTRQPIFGLVGPGAIPPLRSTAMTENSSSNREPVSRTGVALHTHRPEYDRSLSNAAAILPARQALVPSGIPGTSQWPRPAAFPPNIAPGGAAPAFSGRPLSSPTPGPAHGFSTPAPVHAAPAAPMPGGAKK